MSNFALFKGKISSFFFLFLPITRANFSWFYILPRGAHVYLVSIGSCPPPRRALNKNPWIWWWLQSSKHYKKDQKVMTASLVINIAIAKVLLIKKCKHFVFSFSASVFNYAALAFRNATPWVKPIVGFFTYSIWSQRFTQESSSCSCRWRQ